MRSRTPSQHLPVTRAAVVQVAARALERIGLPAELYARRTGVAHGWLESDPEALVPIHRVYRFFEEAGRDVDGFGAIAAEIPLEAAGRFGRMVRGRLTLLDALEQSVALGPALGTVHDSRLIRDANTGGVWFARSPMKAALGVVPQVELLVLRFMIQVGRLAAGPDWQPAALRFCSVEEARRALDHVPAFRGVPTETGTRWGGVLFPRETLGLPLPEADSTPLDDGEAWCEEGPAGPLAVALRQLVLSGLRADQDVSLPSIAASLEVHHRTLQRRLVSEGASYREVLDQARYVRARELITAHRDASLTAIAFELGYGDLAAFSRAFRRWCGEPPRALRRRLETAS